ncbi:MAG: universal stress protein [Helicobacteraceae bacterium]|nr:universal stress protein [Helicobacteraceae bacterium]
MKTIVAATDFSPRSAVAVNKAAALAKLSGARLALVHAINPRSFFGRLFNKIGVESALEASKKRLNETLEALGVQGEAIALEGAPSATIIQTAKELQADLIALGDHGEFHISDLLLGTTARRAIELADLPILVVKNENAVPYKRVMIAADFSESSVNAANFALESFGDAEFIVFNAYLAPNDITASYYGALTDEASSMLETMRNEAIANLDEFVKSPIFGDREVKTIVRASASPSDTILETARGEGVDLIVAGAKGIESFVPMMIGSSAESLLRRSDIDMLVARR